MSTTLATAPAGRPASPRPLPPLAALVAGAWNDRQGRQSLLGAAACLALLAILFRATLANFVFVWWTNQNYSHGFLVPLISLYFANEAARRGPIAYRPAVGLGAVLIGAAVLGKLATVLVPVGIVGDLSFVVGLTGVVALFGGAAALRRFSFALAFLVFMIPLPVHLYTTIANPLQLLVSRVAAVLMNAGGIPVFCEGNHLTLPGDVKMFVAEACSGMRQLTGFLALTTAVAFLSERPIWYRGLLVASAVPIALTANITRVLLTGWIMYHDPQYAQGTFHTIEGLLMMGFGLALLSFECRLLDLIQGLWADPAEGADNSSSPSPQAA